MDFFGNDDEPEDSDIEDANLEEELQMPEADWEEQTAQNFEEDNQEDTYERPTKDESTVGKLAASMVTLVPKPMLGIRGTLYKRMVIKGLENYHKTAGGDAIAINGKAGQQIDLEPVQYRSPEGVDEGEKPGWKVKGRDKVWNPGKEGNSVNYLGRTPTVLLEDDEHVEAGWLAPRIGQAIEMDNYWPIFTNAKFNAVIDAGAAGGGRNPAMADGGFGNIELELDHPGEWAGDNIIDLGSGEGYDGMRISTAKAREWQAEHTDSEHMQMQEDRGYLRGLANGDNGPGMVKILMLCAAIILGTLAIVLLGPELVGGGDGGGGINPLISTLTMSL